MFKVNNKEIIVFIINFEHISHFVLVLLLLTLNMQLPAGVMHLLKLPLHIDLWKLLLLW